MQILILERVFEKTRDYLSAKGLLLREGTIVDAAIINKTPYKKWIKGQKNLKAAKKSVENRKSELQSGFVNFIRGSLRTNATTTRVANITANSDHPSSDIQTFKHPGA